MRAAWYEKIYHMQLLTAAFLTDEAGVRIQDDKKGRQKIKRKFVTTEVRKVLVATMKETRR